MQAATDHDGVVDIPQVADALLAKAAAKGGRAAHTLTPPVRHSVAATTDAVLFVTVSQRAPEAPSEPALDTATTRV